MNISQAVEALLRTIPISVIVWSFGYVVQRLAVNARVRAPRWLIRLCLITPSHPGVNPYAAAIQVMALAMPLLKFADRLTLPMLKLPVSDTVFSLGTVTVFLASWLILRVLPPSADK